MTLKFSKTEDIEPYGLYQHTFWADPCVQPSLTCVVLSPKKVPRHRWWGGGCRVKTELQLLASHSPSIQMSKRTNKSWRNSQPLKPAKLAELATIYAKLDSLPYLQWPAQRGVVHTLLTWSSACILPTQTDQAMAGYQKYKMQPRLRTDIARLLNMQKWPPFMQFLD